MQLTSPTGSNYEFCVYDVGFAGDGATCTTPAQKLCSTTGSNSVTLNYEGDCGFTDTRYFYVEVKLGSGNVDSCQPYTLTVASLDNVPQKATCTF